VLLFWTYQLETNMDDIASLLFENIHKIMKSIEKKISLSHNL